KGSELVHYKELDRVIYYGPDQIDKWADVLEAQAEGLAVRYKRLVERGLREALEGDERDLIVIDEVQKGTRKKELGTVVKDSLTLISEQCAALHDTLVMSTQRSINAIPPSTRENVDCWLSMLGSGYFYLKPDGTARSSGRTSLIEPDDVIEVVRSGAPALALTYENLPAILGSQPVVPGRATVTLYEGIQGSGKTHCLRNHPVRHPRVIYVDLAQSHKKVLEIIIESASAIVPPKATISDLAQIASLAIQAEATLLLLDNLDRISLAMTDTLNSVIETSAEVAMTARPAETPMEHKKMDHFISRSVVIEIKKLEPQPSKELADRHLPGDIESRDDVIRHILRMSNGHPRTIINLATQTQTGSLRELREFKAPATQGKPINVSWLPILLILFGFVLWQADGYMMTAFGALVFMVVRRRFMSTVR
ncbi:MAG: hypothetical protein AAF639_43095, partial [Chloroflexota bacterium]